MIYGTVSLRGRKLILEDARWRVKSDPSAPQAMTDEQMLKYLELCFPWNVSPADGQPGVALLKEVARALNGTAEYPRPPSPPPGAGGRDVVY